MIYVNSHLQAAIFSSLRDLTFFLITMGLILLFFLLSDKVEIWQPLRKW